MKNERHFGSYFDPFTVLVGIPKNSWECSNTCVKMKVDNLLQIHEYKGHGFECCVIYIYFLYLYTKVQLPEEGVI